MLAPVLTAENSQVKSRAIRSSTWTLLGYGSHLAIRLGSNLILTRLLVPEMFGIMAIAQVFITGMAMFSDIGINTSIIKHKSTATPSFLNTAWSLQIIRGVLMAIICALLAYPVSQIYAEPMLFPVMAVLGLNVLVKGFQTTAFATSEKNLSIGKTTMIEVFSQLVGVALMILISYLYSTIWALVIGTIASSITSVTLGHTLLNGQHRHAIKVDKSHFHEIIKFGKWIFISSLIGFFANQLDKLILGKVFTMHELGIYTVAYTLAQLPAMVSTQIGNKVMLPVYASLQSESIEKVRSYALKMRLAVGSLTLAPAVFLMVFGEQVIDLLYDDRYADGGWMVKALALGFAIRVSTNIGPYLLSRGNSKVFTGLVAMETAILLVCMLGGWFLFSTVGVIYAFAVANFLVYCVRAFVHQKYKMWLWKLDFSFLTVVFCILILSNLL